MVTPSTVALLNVPAVHVMGGAFGGWGGGVGGVGGDGDAGRPGGGAVSVWIHSSARSTATPGPAILPWCAERHGKQKKKLSSPASAHAFDSWQRSNPLLKLVVDGIEIGTYPETEQLVPNDVSVQSLV